MKKLLSICFLSVLLGLMSFSAKAQCGFWVENLQPDTLYGVANSGNDNGVYALNHTLGNAVLLEGQNNRYLGNVGTDAIGQTQLYELHICPCPEYEGKKVSIDWVLERRNDAGEWVVVNDYLSNYAKFGIFTRYPQINTNQSECQSIQWLGGIVPDGYGFCNETDTYSPLDEILANQVCNTPTNYPGALPTQSVLVTNEPGTVLATMPTPSSPMVNIYSQGFDYFYYDFLASTRNIVAIQWLQTGDYRLTMRIRERFGGSDWYNAQWGGNELAHIGGHQSCCGPVLMEDILHYPVFDTLSMEICENAEAVVMGGPAPTTYAFHANIPDTTLLYGTFEGAGDCAYINIDTIQNVSFFLRHNPVLEAEALTICKCDAFNTDSLQLLVHPDLTGLTDNDSYQILWQKENGDWTPNPVLPNGGLVPGIYTFTAKQVNTYNDTLECESEPVTFTVTVEEMQAPEITVTRVDFCLEEIDSTTVFNAVSVPDPNCANTTRWYTKLNAADYSALYQNIEVNEEYRVIGNLNLETLLAGQGNALEVNVMEYMPSINKDTTLYFFAVSYNGVTDCESPIFSFVKVNLHQTPVLVATPMDSMYCPGGDVTMKVTTKYTPNTVKRNPYNYYWVNRDTVESNSKVNTYVHTLGNICGVDYVTNVFVIDSNGCKSAPVTFNYFTGDTIKPVITPAQLSHFVEACEVTSDNAPIYNTLEDVVEAFDLTIDDNCDVELVTFVGVTDEVVSTEYCNDSHKRTYTFADACGNQSTFIEIVTPRDEQAPEFTFDRPIRLLPIPAGNCTYDCPDSMTLIAAIAPYVYDNCTDSAYLMQSITFVWENTGLPPFGENGKDIFRVENHLTINATITDRCNNTTSTAVFFLDRPEQFVVGDDGIHATPEFICYGDTITLAFDTTVCVDDSVVGPFNPYTYKWIANRGDVEFIAQNALTTEVAFTGYGYYEFQMVVANDNGCYDTSDVQLVYVRKNPVVAITPVPADVETPLCPTYGYLDIRADLIDPVPGQTLKPHSFVWEGESVNNASDADTSFIHIIPVYCDTLYTARVYAVDDKGCVATAEYSVRAKAKTPSFTPNIPDYTLVPQAPGCALLVPDFKEYILASMINDECYEFNIGIKYHQEAGVDTLVENLIINGSTYDWYTQTPAAGQQVYGDSVVTITIVNPCGAVMEGTVQLRKPTDYITVTVENPEQDVCQFDLLDGGFVTFDAVSSKANSTFAWTELNNDQVLSDEAQLMIADTLMEAGDDYINYYYLVTATDEQQCSAIDTAVLTVYYQGKDVQTRVWDDNMCTADNGIIAVDTVPTGYTVILTGVDVEYDTVVKISDVPHHQGTNWNTIYFDSLSTGTYLVTVINLHGCDRFAEVFVGEDGNNVTPAIVAVTPAQCNGQNGNIAVTEQPGYTYELYKQIPLTGAPTAAYGWQLQENYEGTVDAGVYFIRKISNTTFCYKDSTFTVDIEASEFDFTVTITNRTNCYSDNSAHITSSVYNGKIVFNNTNYTYRIKRSVNGIDWPTDWSEDTYNTQVTGLDYGFYAIKALNEEGCLAFDTVEVKDARVNPKFTVSTTPNNACEEEFNNGVITFNPANTYTYFVNNVLSTSPVTSLADGNYYVLAIDPTTYCRKDTIVNVDLHPYLPVVTIDTIYNNTSCDPEAMPYNGAVKFDVTSEVTCDHLFKLYDNAGNGWQSAYVTDYQSTYPDGNIVISQNGISQTITFNLNANEYSESVRLIAGEPATITFTPSYWGYVGTMIDEDLYDRDLEYFELYNASNQNILTLFAEDGDSTVTFIPTCPTSNNSAFQTYIKPYDISITQDGVEVKSVIGVNDPVTTVSGLNKGNYEYTITSKFGCLFEGEFTIGHDSIPPMLLTMIPNNYCGPMGTTKPGNGQVIILSPVLEEGETDHFYVYNFFDSTYMEMQVPYDLPLTHTMYWMADGLYHVGAYDTVTGCYVEDSIYVELDIYEFELSITTTTSQYCDPETGDGTATVTIINAEDPDGYYVYSMDGEDFSNTTGVFTGLAVGSYQFWAKDLNTGCIRDARAIVEDSLCQPKFFITDGTDTNKNFSYCIYDADVTLTGWVITDCDDNFEYSWKAPCSNIDTSDNASIQVDIDHVMPNGCTYIFHAYNPVTQCKYDTLITVTVHERPDFYFTINGCDVPTNVPNRYCEQENLLIAVVPMNNVKVDSYIWTQGWDGTDSSFNFLGSDTNLNDLTFCVKIIDEFNCVSNIGSLPVSLNRMQYTDIYDTACGTIMINNIEYGPFTVDSAFVVEQVVPGGWHTAANCAQNSSCDNINIHNVMLYAMPNANFDTLVRFMEDTFYCSPTTVLAEIKAAVQATVTPASAVVDIVDYDSENDMFVVLNTSTPLTYGDFIQLESPLVRVSNQCDTIFGEFWIDLRTKPIIDTLIFQDYYCPGETATITAGITHHTSVYYDAPAYLLKRNATNAQQWDTLDMQLVEPDYDEVEFTFVASALAFNNTDLRITVDNGCGIADTIFRIYVDTTDILPMTLTKVYCEGDTMKYSDFIVNGLALLDNSQATVRVLRQNAPSPVYETIELPYVVTLDEDSMLIHFEFTSRCGYIILTQDDTVFVKPLPKIDADPFGELSLCLSTAVQELTDDFTPTVTDATVHGWVLIDTLTGLKSATMSTQALVDTVKKVSSVKVYYWADNESGCRDTIVFMGVLRLLDTVRVTVPNLISICPNNVFYGSIVDITNPSTSYDRNNYEENEVQSSYWIKTQTAGWQVITASSNPLPIQSGDSVMVTYTPGYNNSPNCGPDTGYIRVVFYDTTYNEPTMQEACEGQPFTEFVYEQPQWTGSNIVNSSSWTVWNVDSADYISFNTDTVFQYSANEPVYVQYVWYTSCGEFTTQSYELEFLRTPTVAIIDPILITGTEYDTLPVCLNSVVGTLSYAVYDPSDIVIDTTWTLDGDAIELDQFEFTSEDNDKLLVVTLSSVCGDVADTVIVKILPLPIPNVIGDTRICKTNSEAVLGVVNPDIAAYEYQWQYEVDGEFVNVPGGAGLGVSLHVSFDTIDGQTRLIFNYDTSGAQFVPISEFYYFKVVATELNGYGCSSTDINNISLDAFDQHVITIKTTDDPQFIFKYQGVETHQIDNLTTGNMTEYTWEINHECVAGDVLVFVEYTIYHNGRLINKDSLGTYFQPQTFNSNTWITRNHISWENSQQNTLDATGYYNSSIPGFEDAYSGAQSGNHFPNQDMAFGNNQQFDDIFMHFLNKRPVDKTIAPFVTNGEYKIVYRLIATDYQSTYQHLYWNADSAKTLRIGGHNAYSGSLRTLAVDSILLIVGGENLAAVENPVAPTMAPAISTDETVIVPEMEVWPNPAPAIVTTFKARVYNMSGDATVTITNFSGKQVYSGNIHIDHDGYYFEADVNSLAVGAYIMTVRTQDAVVTKKLVVTVRQ